MVLIARLAVDKREQGAGLGTRLLADALRMVVLAGESVAARLVVVDALDEQAAGFYRRHGFTDTLDRSLRLYRRKTSVPACSQQTSSRAARLSRTASRTPRFP
jgi:ribosomal protein S18 acetylase RimI-like enzyme